MVELAGLGRCCRGDDDTDRRRRATVEPAVHASRRCRDERSHPPPPPRDSRGRFEARRDPHRHLRRVRSTGEIDRAWAPTFAAQLHHTIYNSTSSSSTSPTFRTCTPPSNGPEHPSRRVRGELRRLTFDAEMASGPAPRHVSAVGGSDGQFGRRAGRDTCGVGSCRGPPPFLASHRVRLTGFTTQLGRQPCPTRTPVITPLRRALADGRERGRRPANRDAPGRRDRS